MQRWHLDIPAGVSRVLWVVAGLVVFGIAAGWAILSRTIERLPVDAEAAQAQVLRRTAWLEVEVLEARADARELRTHIKKLENAVRSAQQLQTEVVNFDWMHGDQRRAAELAHRVEQWNRKVRQSGLNCAVILPAHVTTSEI